jgi:hypothetical protein
MTTVAAERERLDSTGQLHWGAEAILRTPFSSMSASAVWLVDRNGAGCRFVSEHNLAIEANAKFYELSNQLRSTRQRDGDPWLRALNSSSR